MLNVIVSYLWHTCFNYGYSTSDLAERILLENLMAKNKHLNLLEDVKSYYPNEEIAYNY